VPLVIDYPADTSRLDLSGQPIRDQDLAGLRGLTALQQLDLSYTQISDAGLAHLRGLTSLQLLYLQGTQISDLAPLAGLLIEGMLRELSLSGSGLRAQPPELAEAADPAAAFRSYFEDLRRGAVRNTDLKLVLVGNAQVGKTTLKPCLVHGEPPREPIQERTHGIDATTLGWPAGDEAFRLTIWDLAGQEIYHTMHRFLLQPRVVFLLLWAEQTEETDLRELHPVTYWLDLIR
jgi:hypothetical protein